MFLGLGAARTGIVDQQVRWMDLLMLPAVEILFCHAYAKRGRPKPLQACCPFTTRAKPFMFAQLQLTDSYSEEGKCVQYATWCAGGNKDSFFTYPYCQQLYMNHIKTFVNR